MLLFAIAPSGKRLAMPLTSRRRSPASGWGTTEQSTNEARHKASHLRDCLQSEWGSWRQVERKCYGLFTHDLEEVLAAQLNWAQLHLAQQVGVHLATRLRAPQRGLG